MQVILRITNLPTGSNIGPNFNVVPNVGVASPATVTLAQLLAGVTVMVNDLTTDIQVKSTGSCDNVVDLDVPAPNCEFAGSIDLSECCSIGLVVEYIIPDKCTTTTTTTIVPCSQPVCKQTFEGYGYLYNWYAIGGNGGRDVGGIVKTNQNTVSSIQNQWRVPSDADWDVLVGYLGGPTVAGGKLKTICTAPFTTNFGLWEAPNTAATNEMSWSGVPGGYRSNTGIFDAVNMIGGWWSSTEVSPNSNPAWSRILNYDNSDISRTASSKPIGFSIRLVRPATPLELDLEDGTTSEQWIFLPPYIGNDDNAYVTVKIGTQVWTAQNLMEGKYNNNTFIFDEPLPASWATLTTGAFCIYAPLTLDQGSIDLCNFGDLEKICFAVGTPSAGLTIFVSASPLIRETAPAQYTQFINGKRYYRFQLPGDTVSYYYVYWDDTATYSASGAWVFGKSTNANTPLPFISSTSIWAYSTFSGPYPTGDVTPPSPIVAWTNTGQGPSNTNFAAVNRGPCIGGDTSTSTTTSTTTSAP